MPSTLLLSWIQVSPVVFPVVYTTLSTSCRHCRICHTIRQGYGQPAGFSGRVDWFLFGVRTTLDSEVLPFVIECMM
jgi:hypothetical protein